jgi:hypothetical protein
MFQTKIYPHTIVDGKIYNVGSRLPTPVEKMLGSMNFKIIKCNNRPKPGRRNCVIFSLMGEFGSNTIAGIACISFLMRDRYAGKYSTVLTWPGTSYLYKHLVDEIIEIFPEHGYLKEYTRAFHHNSKNLKRLEVLLDYHGTVIGANELGKIALTEIYPKIPDVKLDTVFPPTPSQDKMDSIRKYIKSNSVIVTGRNRACYGRNLSPEFYGNLIKSIKDKGYNVIWTGDETSLPCPPGDVIDFTKTPESKDIECTFALTSQVKATVQFFTASHRIAAMSGTPHIITESDQQVLSKTASGQEGYRMFLADKDNKRKIIISHFWNAYYAQDKCIELVLQALQEIEQNNFAPIIGQVENPDYIKFLLKQNEFLIPK